MGIVVVVSEFGINMYEMSCLHCALCSILVQDLTNLYENHQNHTKNADWHEPVLCIVPRHRPGVCPYPRRLC